MAQSVPETADHFLSQSQEAKTWVKNETDLHNNNSSFGKVVSGLIWYDLNRSDNECVGSKDPKPWIERINSHSAPYILNHDPGLPAGRIVSARLFTTEDGATKFMLVVIGLYDDNHQLSFDQLGIDNDPDIELPLEIPDLPDGSWLSVSFDPKDIDQGWINNLVESAPLKVEQRQRSLNALEDRPELISLNVVYIALVWNPFVTTIAKELGKDTYASIHDWLRNLFGKLSSFRNPTVEIKSCADDCEVNFLFRGKNTENLYLAHESLSKASLQAAKIVENMKEKGSTPISITYEFDVKSAMWYPSYVILDDYKFISDRNLKVRG